MQFVDIGVNLTNPQFGQDQADIWSRAQANGVVKMLLTGTHLPSSHEVLELAMRLGEGVYSTAGIHPHDASSWQQNSYAELKQLLQQPKVKAVGETGLDFNRNFSTPDEQRIAFEQQLNLALELNKPMFLHERDASDALLEILTPKRSELTAAVVHCFTGNETELKKYLEQDLYIGITGWICDERRGLDLQKIVRYIPRNRLLIETDAPFLLPRDLQPKPKNRRNEPCYLPHIAQRIAEFRQESLEALAQQLYMNSCELFQLN